jgi:hypothetical protein
MSGPRQSDAWTGTEPLAVTAAHAPGAVTLVVRLWFEGSATDPAAGEWRGEVKQVPSGRVFYFRGLDGLVDRVRAVIEEEA